MALSSRRQSSITIIITTFFFFFFFLINSLPSHSSSDQFPSWITEKDKRLLKGNAVPDVVVAADGTGHYRKVMDAVSAAPDNNKKRYVILVKKGVYPEYVVISQNKQNMQNIMMIGEGIDVTVITGSRNYADGWDPFRSATFIVDGSGFIGHSISFENTAGPRKGQAVALRSGGPDAVYYRCGIFGYQDTLYAISKRQFYRECRISGTVDFIFGDAAAVFQNCVVLARRGWNSQINVITAQGRTDPKGPTGFTFQFCNISADSDLLPYVGTIPTYLGRPWFPYSRAVFMQSYMSNVISPEGWIPWNKSNFYLDTLTYGEFKNVGAGAAIANRVKWSGYHVLDENEAKKFTVAEFIQGDLWLPSTGVNYTSGL